MRASAAVGIIAASFGVFALVAGALAAPGPAAVQPSGCSTGLELSTSQASGPAPLVVTFDLTIDWGIVGTAHWDFGDGSAGQFYNGSGPAYYEPSHTYATVGTFTAQVTVNGSENDQPKRGVCTVDITTTPPPLQLSVNATPRSGQVPLAVTFFANISGGSGTFPDATWVFGDGDSGSGPVITHTYSTPGEYQARFTVTDSDGGSANGSVLIQVQAVPVPHSNNVNYGTIGIVGFLAVVLAGFAGGVLYVRAHPLRFGSSGSRSEPGSGDGGPVDSGGPIAGTLGSPVAPPGDGPGPPSVELAVPYEPVLPETAYRGVFLDLSDREFDVLAEPTTTELAIRPGSPIADARPARPRLSHRVVLHLASQPRLGPDDVATVAFTQSGMVSSLGVPQSILSNVLRRLTYAKIIEHAPEHVQGSARRLNVYRLSAKGEQLAARLKKAEAAALAKGPPAAAPDRSP